MPKKAMIGCKKSQKKCNKKKDKTYKCHHRVRLEAVAAKKIERYKKVPLEKGLKTLDMWCVDFSVHFLQFSYAILFMIRYK